MSQSHEKSGAPAGVSSRIGRVVTRRDFLSATVTGTALLTGYGGWSNALEVVRVSAPRDPARPIRVAFLSDMHAPHSWVGIEQLAEEVARFAPDVVCIGGDAVEDRRDVALVREYGALRAPLGVYAVLGNWEYYGKCDLRELRRHYAAAGVRLLVNERIVLGGGLLELVGLDDWVEGRPDYSVALGSRASAEPSVRRLVLSHCPVTFDLARDHRDRLRSEAGWRTGAAEDGAPGALPVMDLLAGHTHGGQIVPFGHPLLLPIGAGGYVHGLYPTPEGDRMYVTRGLGNTGLRFRVGARPELSLLTL